MHHSYKDPFEGRLIRRGLSLFETLACLVALAGGVTLGSIYLGIDVKQLAAKVLQDQDSVAVVQSDLGASTAAAEPEAEPNHDAATDQAAPAPTTPVAVSDLQTATALVERPTTPKPSAAVAPVAEKPPASSQFSSWVASLNEESMLTQEQRKTLTKSYWASLAECLDAESANRNAILADREGLQLFDYLAHRQKLHRAAADTLGELRRAGVDPHVASFAEKAHAWQEEGASLFARARDLLTDAPTAQLTGPFAQSWQSAATQHRMEERLLVEKRKAVESYLNHMKDDAASPPRE